MISIVSQNEQYVLRYGSDLIPFDVEFQERKRLTISVYPEGKVEVIAPNGHGMEAVLSKVKKRANWIARQRAHFELFQPLPKEKQFVSGETHHYLGRQYRLKIKHQNEESVKLKGKFLMVNTPQPKDRLHIKSLIEQWYRKRAQKVFQARLDWCLASTSSLLIELPGFSIQKMARRWGSCTPAGNIILNLDLIKTPLLCIEYVIMHELCHLRIHNHTPAYYRLLSRCMPDWEARKARLSTFVI